VRGLDEAIAVRIVDLTDLNPAEVVDEVIPAHPEASIVCICVESHFFLEGICPAVAVVTPVSCPFEVPPGVSEFDKFNFVSELICDYFTG